MWWKIMFLLTLGSGSILSSSFDISGIVSGNRMAGVPLGRSLGDGEIDVLGICREPGMTCQNCLNSITCVPLPGGWLMVPLQQCPEGTTCNAHLGKCSDRAVPECQKESNLYQHTCEQVGIFPDAHDCRKFHLCSPPDAIPDGRPADHRVALCPRHYGYNPQTAQCSIKLKNGQCSEKPVPKCNQIGEAAAIPSSPNYYYVCLLKHGVLYPQIFLCPHGWYFWDGFCRPEPPQNVSNESKSSEETTTELEKKTESPYQHQINFFSTEKSTTYPADSFLADKFDFTNADTVYENVPSVFENGGSDEFRSSFEDW